MRGRAACKLKGQDPFTASRVGPLQEYESDEVLTCGCSNTFIRAKARNWDKGAAFAVRLGARPQMVTLKRCTAVSMCSRECDQLRSELQGKKDDRKPRSAASSWLFPPRPVRPSSFTKANLERDLVLESPAVAVKADNSSSNIAVTNNLIKHAWGTVFLDCSNLVE